MTNEETPQPQQPLQGDEEQLFTRYADRLLAATRRALPGVSPEIIEDACAAAWMQLVRYQPERSAVFAWLQVTALRQAYKMLRTEKRHPHGSLDALTRGDEGFEAFIAGQASVEGSVEASELLAQVAALPGGQAEVMFLSLSGRNPAEIADELGMTERQVRKRIEKARRALREKLGE